jgi:hypothetical protein
MNAAVRWLLVAIPLTGVAAFATLVVGSALPGLHFEQRVSTQQRSLATGAGPSHCHKAARHHRDFGAQIPPEPPGDDE